MATGNMKYSNSVHNDLSPENLNEHFANVGRNIINSFHHYKQPNWKNPKCIYTFDMKVISESEVNKLLSNLSCDSNLDVLDFDSKLIKISSSFILKSLTFIFNYSLKNGIVFHDWKYSRVTPIYKGK